MLSKLMLFVIVKIFYEYILIDIWVKFEFKGVCCLIGFYSDFVFVSKELKKVKKLVIFE